VPITKVLFTLLFLPAALLAQSPDAAVGSGNALWAGVEVSRFCPDWTPTCRSVATPLDRRGLYGAGAFADYKLYTMLGAETEARWLPWAGYSGQTQSSWLAGPRIGVVPSDRAPLTGWIRFVAGAGHIYLPPGGSATYFAYGGGATVQYRLAPRLFLRADYELQYWPKFPPHGLTPEGFSVGVAYRFKVWARNSNTLYGR
jgi:hypothetical protein